MRVFETHFPQQIPQASLNPDRRVTCRPPFGVGCRDLLAGNRPVRFRRSHGDVDILEDLAALNAATAIGRFDEIVARLAAMLPSESIDEGERFGERAGFDEKACAKYLPCCGRVVHFIHPWGRETVEFWFEHLSEQEIVRSTFPPLPQRTLIEAGRPTSKNSLEANSNLIATEKGVNSKFCVQAEKWLRGFARD